MIVRNIFGRLAYHSAMRSPAPRAFFPAVTAMSMRFQSTADNQNLFELLEHHRVIEAAVLWRKDPSILALQDEAGRTPLLRVIDVCEADVKKATQAFTKMNREKLQDIEESRGERSRKMAILKDNLDYIQAHYKEVGKLAPEMLTLGADGEATDNSGGTVLMYASHHGLLKVCQELMKKKVQVNSQDFSGKTALIHATQGGHDKIVALLLENEADPNILTADEDGSNDWAPQNKRLEMRPHTALDHAIFFNHMDCAKLLRAKGGVIASWLT